MSKAAGQAPCGLSVAVLAGIAETLGAYSYCPLDRVRLFGSRAKGNYRAASDIDLCVDAPSLAGSERLRLEGRLDDLLLPWKIDLVYWDTIDNIALREHIERVGIPLSKLV